jgi:hypothetical protein
MLTFIVGQSFGINWWWNNYRGEFRHLLYNYQLHKEMVLPYARKVVHNYGQPDFKDQLVNRVKYYFERDCHECQGEFTFESTWKKFECKVDRGKVKCWLPIPDWNNAKWIFQDDPTFDKYVYSKWSCEEIQSSNPACKQKNIH